MRAKFFMRGGHVVTAEGVSSVSIGNTTDGGFSSYSIRWKNKQKQPALFSLALPDICAIVVEKTFWEHITGGQ